MSSPLQLLEGWTASSSKSLSSQSQAGDKKRRAFSVQFKLEVLATAERTSGRSVGVGIAQCFHPVMYIGLNFALKTRL